MYEIAHRSGAVLGANTQRERQTSKTVFEIHERCSESLIRIRRGKMRRDERGTDAPTSPVNRENSSSRRVRLFDRWKSGERIGQSLTFIRPREDTMRSGRNGITKERNRHLFCQHNRIDQASTPGRGPELTSERGAEESHIGFDIAHKRHQSMRIGNRPGYVQPRIAVEEVEYFLVKGQVFDSDDDFRRAAHARRREHGCRIARSVEHYAPVLGYPFHAASCRPRSGPRLPVQMGEGALCGPANRRSASVGKGNDATASLAGREGMGGTAR
jgi:hypothetical protein